VFGYRPHFSQSLDGTPDELQSRLLEELRRAGGGCELKSFPGFICLRVPPAERHFWSPRLNLALEADDERGTRVEGVYGPNGNVWSLFVYGWLIVGSVALFAGALGWAQASLERNPWGLWVFGASLAGAIALHLLARLGRRLGADQTERLHAIYQQAIGRTVELD